MLKVRRCDKCREWILKEKAVEIEFYEKNNPGIDGYICEQCYRLLTKNVE